MVQYDLITTHITNALFRARVERALSHAVAKRMRHIQIEPLTADDVNIQPGDFVAGLMAFSAPWIDVDSDDELLSHVSRQVLNLELDYAAFCGVGHVVVAGPKLDANIVKYAQAIDKALSHSAYMQLLVQLEFEGGLKGSSGNFVPEDTSSGVFSQWDVWNTVRTVCKYNAQLSIGGFCRPACRLLLALGLC